MDLWDTENNITPKLTDESVNVSLEGNETIDTNNLPLFLKYPSFTYIKDNLLYTVDESDYFPTSNSTLQEFTYNKDTYYENNDPTYTISLYKIQLP